MEDAISQGVYCSQSGSRAMWHEFAWGLIWKSLLRLLSLGEGQGSQLGPMQRVGHSEFMRVI